MPQRLRTALAFDARGFTMLELLIVTGIIAILAALAAAGLMRARLSSNEASAVASIRAIGSAQASYAAGCGGGGYAQSLADLHLAPEGGVAFIGADLAEDGTQKSGYLFSLDDGTDTSVVQAADLTCNESTEDAVATYYAHGEPLIDGLTGVRSFGTDQRGTIYQRTDGEEVGNTFGSATALQ